MKGGIVKLVDINDYITPNQSCINIIEINFKKYFFLAVLNIFNLNHLLRQ